MAQSLTRVVSGELVGNINLTSANVDFTSGALTGGRLNHSAVLSLLESARCAWGAPTYKFNEDITHQVSNGVQVLSRHYTVREELPVDISAGPLAGTGVLGFSLCVATLGNTGTPNPVVAQYFIPYTALDDLKTAAVPCVQVLP